MKIALIYDSAEYYGLEYNEYECDFCSIATAESMYKAMIMCGHSVELIKTKNEILDLRGRRKEFDLIFNTFEGRKSINREALVPAYLEFLDIPFIGANASVGIITLNKVFVKKIATSLGIMTPKSSKLSPSTKVSTLKQQIQTLKLPIIIKPIFAGNSEATKVFENIETAIDYIKTLEDKYSEVLCEEFIIGKELTVPILGNGNEAKCLGVSGYLEQKDGNFWLDSHYKVYGGFTDCKATLPFEVETKILNAALAIYNEINCIDYSRIDFRLSTDNIPYLLEANAFPDLYESGSFATLYRQQNKSYNDLINDIITIAAKRNGLFPK